VKCCKRSIWAVESCVNKKAVAPRTAAVRCSLFLFVRVIRSTVGQLHVYICSGHSEVYAVRTDILLGVRPPYAEPLPNKKLCVNGKALQLYKYGGQNRLVFIE
jgi:hypothetical protein